MYQSNSAIVATRTLVLLLGVLVFAPTMVRAAQISITSPANGTVYHPGDTVAVQVNNPDGAQLLFGGGQYLSSNFVLVTKSPYAHAFTIPTDIPAAGDYYVSVIDLSTKSETATRVAIHIEPLISPNATLYTSPHKVLEFEYPGLTQTVSVSLKPGMNVSASNQLQASVADNQIARVNGTSVTALSSGSTSVTYSLGGVSTTLKILVDKASGVRGDLTGDGIVDLNDLAIIQSALNTKAGAPNDPRDLNGDGKIDALDARILTTLCTYHGCGDK